ncbi:MAG TPA: class I tRNA ligase family protein, partial [Flavipsychrobacter sp.]|nr:class I tRNA ligase family protein [Flavipsychrobacter sp.]
MEYAFRAIEQKWKKYWNDEEVYKVSNLSEKPKFYILDMFPYPSGAGLHVGHPLGYIASDIYARYKRLRGYNVLHPMGFDAFGLPAEQYAIETGQHPAVTTEKNITRYREQLDNIGFCYDWDRSVITSNADYYKWTQWIFLQLFHSWYDRKQNRARPIKDLITIFEKEGNSNNPCPDDDQMCFDGKQWKNFSEKEKRDTLMRYRLAYQGYAEVWWCEALGTVLANDEVINGVSERGGYPAERKQMRQWFLRITEFAERLQESLDTLDWSEAMKEMQRNWIGKSNGAEVRFEIQGFYNKHITVFTTRPDTIFGVDFMVLAPEHEIVDEIVASAQRDAVSEYKQYVKSRSERERMAEVKQVTGCFTGAYALHPLSMKPVPIWISEYVLASYGTGAIMAVPSGDERDHLFSKHFDLPITNIFGTNYDGSKAYSDKTGVLDNSEFLNGIEITKASEIAIRAIVDAGAGRKKVNYRMRDAGFSRQRYWGEPFPIVYISNIPYATDEPELDAYPTIQALPLELPLVENYKPGPEGESPLANVEDWVNTLAGKRETNTMPGYAGSSWYFLRYTDPHNDKEFASRTATDYWQAVDIYIGGTEHAVGHLLYARMWTKALYDLGHIGFDEPFKKLINQGMIQGSSRFVFELIVNKMSPKTNARTGRIFVSKSHYENLVKIQTDKEKVIQYLIDNGVAKYDVKDIRPDTKISIIKAHIDVNIVDGLELNVEEFSKRFNITDTNGYIIREDDGKYICDAEIEKMSKSKYNVVNPDDIVEQYGADTFRMYEMFLGPVEMSKPWDTKGIEGVFRFLKKMWRLYFDEQKGWIVTDEKPIEAELRIIHKTIKKVGDDIERFSFNTSVSQFMICVNELAALNCHKRDILEALVVLICPFAPHYAEELWHR